MTDAPSISPAATVEALLQSVAPLVKAQRWDELQPVLLEHQDMLAHHADGAFIVGLMYASQDKNKEVIRWMKRCLQLNNRHGEAVFYLSAAMFGNGNLHTSLQLMKQFVKDHPKHARGLQLLAKILASQDRAEIAEDLLKRAYALDAKLKFIELDFAICYLAMGEHEQARHWITKALKRQPKHAQVIFNYVFMHDGKIDSDVLKRFLRLEKREHYSDTDRSYIGFSIARAYEKRKQPDEAFTHYEKANAAQRRVQPFSIEPYHKLVDATLERVSQWQMDESSQQGCQDKGAIFVVGLPRSGTTLVQQLLASHSQVTGAGELGHLPELILQRVPKITQTPFPELLDKTTPEQYAAFGAAYLKALKSYGDTPYVVDKMPGNVFHVPFIRRALPNATVIFAHRDPIDVCWSIWRQRFSEKHEYSYDFESIADYAQMTYKILDQYRPIFGDFIHEIHYEQLIAEPETHARQLIDWCGLAWEDDVMDYHKSKQKIRTASVLQANQPIYQSSKRAWLPVKDRLRPLIDALHERGIETCVSRGEVEL